MIPRLGKVSVIGYPTPIGAPSFAHDRQHQTTRRRRAHLWKVVGTLTHALDDEHTDALGHGQEDQVVIPPQFRARFEASNYAQDNDNQCQEDEDAVDNEMRLDSGQDWELEILDRHPISPLSCRLCLRCAGPANVFFLLEPPSSLESSKSPPKSCVQSQGEIPEDIWENALSSVSEHFQSSETWSWKCYSVQGSEVSRQPKKKSSFVLFPRSSCSIGRLGEYKPGDKPWAVKTNTVAPGRIQDV